MNKEIFNTKYPSKRLKFVVSINDEVLTEDTDPDFEINYIDIGNVDSTGKINEVVSYKFSDAPTRARRKVRQGDVIVSTVRTYLKAIASIENEIENLIVSTGFAVVRPKKNIFHPDFCKYTLIESNFIDEVQKRSVGISYPAINVSDLGDIFLPVPTYKTQISISKYLDNEVAKIDALIEKKTRLIDILEERKKAEINQAVTKGLDRNASLKDSGIQWLGEIPKHWKVLKLKYVSNLKSGDFISAENIKEKGDFKVFGGNGERGYFDNYNHEGDIILIGRQGALCGNINFANGKFWATEHAIVCNPTTQFDYYWLGKQLEMMNLNQYSLAAAQPGLSVEVIKNLSIAFPPINEQHLISSYLLEIDKKNALVLKKITDSIDLLEKKRIAIISAAVNGELNACLP